MLRELAMERASDRERLMERYEQATVETAALRGRALSDDEIIATKATPLGVDSAELRREADEPLARSS